jgi:flagellar protein FliS
MLYQSASSAVTDARSHLAAGAIAERSRSINQACGVLAELISSLDRERGGEIAQRLGQLYDYMYARLIEANRQQADAPLADVFGLLTTLSEAWAPGGPVAQPAAVAAITGAGNRDAESNGARNYGAGNYGEGSYGAGRYGSADSGGGVGWAQPFANEPVPAQTSGSHAWSF